jgi:hypothetical protein
MSKQRCESNKKKEAGKREKRMNFPGAWDAESKKQSARSALLSSLQHALILVATVGLSSAKLIMGREEDTVQEQYHGVHDSFHEASRHGYVRYD